MLNPVGLLRYRPTQKSQDMETKNVSYGFSEALNLADDYRDSLPGNRQGVFPHDNNKTTTIKALQL